MRGVICIGKQAVGHSVLKGTLLRCVKVEEIHIRRSFARLKVCFDWCLLEIVHLRRDMSMHDVLLVVFNRRCVECIVPRELVQLLAYLWAFGENLRLKGSCFLVLFIRISHQNVSARVIRYLVVVLLSAVLIMS